MNNNKTDNLIKIWQQTIDVQKHFNEIELRIRNISITLMAAFIGAIGFILHNKSDIAIKFDSVSIPLEELLFALVLLFWFMFYFMERFWYHKLLYGAVRQGTIIEDYFQQRNYSEIQLTNCISEESPIFIPWTKYIIRSKGKIDLYYLGFPILAAMIIKIFFLFNHFCWYGLLISIALFFINLVLLYFVIVDEKKSQPKEEEILIKAYYNSLNDLLRKDSNYYYYEALKELKKEQDNNKRNKKFICAIIMIVLWFVYLLLPVKYLSEVNTSSSVNNNYESFLDFKKQLFILQFKID